MAAPKHQFFPLSSTTRSVVRNFFEWGKFLASGQVQKCGMDLDQTFFFLLEFYLKEKKKRLRQELKHGKFYPKKWMLCEIMSV